MGFGGYSGYVLGETLAPATGQGIFLTTKAVKLGVHDVPIPPFKQCGLVELDSNQGP